MKILNEFVPTRKFLKLADEIKDLVDGWNVTDSAAGFPAPSGVVVSCILKYKYPEKYVCPIFILHYKGPVEVGGLALASDVIGLDGLAVTMGDKPHYGDPIKMLPSSEEARDFIRNTVKTKNLKLGCLDENKKLKRHASNGYLVPLRPERRLTFVWMLWLWLNF